MENGSLVGTYLAYALIVLFLLVLVLALVRTLMFVTAIFFVGPMHDVWTWLRRLGRGARGRESGHEGIESPSEAPPPIGGER